MAVREEYTFISKDDAKSTIHAVKWTPDDNNIKAILQICHGMQEYILRYEGFATFMADHGFAVIGHDHIGHGTTVTDESELGIMHTNSPADVMIEDIFSNFHHRIHIMGINYGSNIIFLSNFFNQIINYSRSIRV